MQDFLKRGSNLGLHAKNGGPALDPVLKSLHRGGGGPYPLTIGIMFPLNEQPHFLYELY